MTPALPPIPPPAFEFRATGAGPFPYHMLGLDRCWPKNTENVNDIERNNLRTIWLHSDRPPSNRWYLSGWTITNIEYLHKELAA